MQAIEQAIRDRRPLGIVYADARGELSERTVEPLALSFQWYAWYMFAYCRARGDYRLFKLPRMVSCAPVPGGFTKEHGDVEALMKTSAARDERPQYRVRVKCKSLIRHQALEYLGSDVVEELEGGDFIIQLPALPWERLWFSLLMGFGDQIEVLEPEEVRAMLKEKARGILSVY